METGQSFEYVGFWSRIYATALDLLMFFLFNVSVLYAIHGPGYSKSDITMRGPVDILNWFVLPNVLMVLFWVICDATPGQMAISARIADAKTGGKPSPRQLIIRYLGLYLSVLPLGLGFLWAAFDSKKQGLHDKLAGTVVVRPKK